MYINLVFAAIAITGGLLLLGRQPRTPGARLDAPGVAAVSGGMFCLVYGFSNAATHSWHTLSTWSFLAAGAVLLIVFAAWQTRAAQPLLPPRVVLDRNRGGAYLTMLIFGSALFGIFLFLIYYMQLNLGYSAVISGAALLPMVAVIGVMANVGNIVLMPRFGPKPLASPSLRYGPDGKRIRYGASGSAAPAGRGCRCDDRPAARAGRGGNLGPGGRGIGQRRPVTVSAAAAKAGSPMAASPRWQASTSLTWCGSRLRTAASASSPPGGLAGWDSSTGSTPAYSAACSACTWASAAVAAVSGMWPMRISTAIVPVTPCRWRMLGLAR